MPTKILGTGLTGLVGSRVVELLNSDYHFKDLSLDSGCDITKTDELHKFIYPEKSSEVLLHFAARTDVDGIEKERHLGEKSHSWQVNVDGTKNIARICRDLKKYLVYISTDYVFDSEQGPYTEKAKPAQSPDGVSWYGWTKLQGEKAIKATFDNWCIIRIAAPYRAHFDKKIDFARDMIERYKQGNLYPLFRDRIHNPLFIDNLAVLLNTIIRNQPKGIFHFGCAETVTPFDFGKFLLREYFGEEPKIENSLQKDYLKKPGVAPRPTRDGYIVKKVETLGIKARSYEEDIKQLVRQMKS